MLVVVLCFVDWSVVTNSNIFSRISCLYSYHSNTPDFYFSEISSSHGGKYDVQS
jgi:hypothetical protein